MDKSAVVAEGFYDHLLIARLFAKRQYHFISQLEWLYNFSGTFNSIIIFHHRSQKTPIPCLPAAHFNSRIIVLSDCTEENIIAKSLYAGAHHYIDLRDTERLLEARIDAALRCHLKRENRILDVAPYTFHLENRTVFRGKHMLDLSPREFELAYYLFSNRDRIVSDSEIMRSVWSLPTSVDSRRIDTSICSIKRKMNLTTAKSNWKVVRLRKQGYQVCCPA